MTSRGEQPPVAAPSEIPHGPPSPFATDYPLEEPGSSPSEQFTFAAICAVTGVVAALPAAWLWASLADPPSATLTADGLKFGETSFDQVTAITLWFVVIGAVFGLVLGFVAGWLGRRHGVVTVVAVVVMSWIGASMTMWFGVHLFGPDHPIDFVALFNGTQHQRTAMLHGFKTGDELVSTLQLTSVVGLVGWPIGAMVGTLAAVTLWPRRVKPARLDRANSPSTAPLVK